MDKIFVKPKAKINLTLNILNTRPDGYHDLESVFETIYLYDEMYIIKKETDGIQINCNIKELENNNILIKAYCKLKENFTQVSGVIVNLNKKIPIQSRTWGCKCRLCGIFNCYE